MRSLLALCAALVLAIAPAPAQNISFHSNPGIKSALSAEQLDRTSNTTLGNVVGLSIALEAGKKYHCWGALFSTIGAAAGGVKMALSSGDTLTVTSMRLGTQVAAIGGIMATALGATIGAASTNAAVLLWNAGLDVNAAGTLVVQAAQQASDPATTSILVNSNMSCARVN